MKEKDTVIRLQGVSKMYKLFNSKVDRMKEALHPLQKKYHKPFYALKDINLEVKRGEILGIVGVNGSGKSTLLKIISGIIPATKGKVNVKGRIIPLLELGSGFNPEFTGLENIYFYNSIHGYTRKQTNAILDEILDFAEIGEFIHQPLKTYSSGMKARLAFAVSVNIDPDILILDEVLSVGDELFRRKCFAKMEYFFKGNKTILFVSHNINNINELCTRAIMLDQAECIISGPTKPITGYYQNYLFTKKEDKQEFRKIIIEENRKQNFEITTNQNLICSDENKIITPIQKNKINEKSISPSKVELFDNTTNRIDTKILNHNYIPGLEPKTTKYIRNKKIDFYNLLIKTIEGLKVNVLQLNEKYIIQYNYKFYETVYNVFFAYSIKNEKGLIIVNDNTRNNTIDSIKAGSTIQVEWLLECKIMPNIYYLTIGTGDQEANEVFIQVEDATAFKVVSPERLTYSGIVDLHQLPLVRMI